MIYEKDESMVFRKIEDETILVPIRNKAGDLQNIFVLNEVGARIWELIDGESDINKISSTICAEYDITSEEAERDLMDFIEDLKSIEALKEK
ncbi:MAG: PqqD family protein [Nitrospirota bacterium]